MKKRLVTLVALIACLSLAVPVGARSFPDTIPLPDGIQPEGITTGNATEFFAGSLANGSIYKGDLRTGEVGSLSVQTDRVAVGLDHDPRSDVLWVAGGATGFAHVYDADSGETIEAVELTTDPAFINDVVVTREAAYLTDSFQPQLYKLPLDDRGLPTGSVETLELSGDFDFVPGDFNANGVDATPRGDTVVIVSSAAEALYTVDPQSGEATEIDLGGDTVTNGDGILLDGKTLYVVQNFLNQIAVVELSADLETGEVSNALTSPDFDIPTTVAEFGNSLYAVNARFATPPGPDVEYDVVRVDKD
jgi:sugar lactone lactonase YvrE